MTPHFAVFDDVRTKVLGEAFDAVCRKLPHRRYADGVREAIAGRIIAIGSASSESDPERLANVVVDSLGLKF